MPQIIPIRDLKNTSAVSDLCHKSREPVYVTKNGYGDMVIMSIENYELILRRMNMYERLENSEHNIKNERVMDARESLETIRKHYDL